MKIFIEHIAIWTMNLEKLRDFYCKYFNGIANDIYINPAKGFESYFISFSSGARLELMKRKDISGEVKKDLVGYAHIAFGLSSIDEVNELTEKLRLEGIEILGEPRWTGDGYYESVIQDPDGNILELVFSKGK
jgi:lactoylglutathione lyase